MTSVAFTGHRPHRFVFGMDEQHSLCVQLKRALYDQVIRFVEEKGARLFYSGAAMGVDLWAAEEVLNARKMNYFDVKLACIIPYEGHCSRWPLSEQERLNEILREADYTITLDDSYNDKVYKRRNFYMIDRSQYLIAICDRHSHKRSGAVQTINYAQRSGLGIVCINPDDAVVTDNFRH